MKREYEVVIQDGHRGMVVRYESNHRKRSKANVRDMVEAFVEKYNAPWNPGIVIHEWKKIN